MPIANGFSYTCSSAAVGGISKLYITNQSDITVNFATGNATIATLQVKTGGVPFKEITFEDDGCSFTESVEVSNNRIIYKPEYKVKIGHRTAQSRGWLNGLAGCDRYIMGHIERATDLKFVTGFTQTQGMRIISAAQQTGNTISDENMVELTFGHPTGVQYPAIVLDGSFPTV